METKFTKGPWGNLSEDESVPDVPCIRIFAPMGKGETEICQVSSFLNYETDEFELRPEDIANAHLIAAAPELYEALSLLEKLMTEFPDDFKIEAKDLAVTMLASELIEKARNALSKAHGEG